MLAISSKTLQNRVKAILFSKQFLFLSVHTGSKVAETDLILEE
jgi:hypothetical protein